MISVNFYDIIRFFAYLHTARCNFIRNAVYINFIIFNRNDKVFFCTFTIYFIILTANSCIIAVVLIDKGILPVPPRNVIIGFQLPYINIDIFLTFAFNYAVNFGACFNILIVFRICKQIIVLSAYRDTFRCIGIFCACRCKRVFITVHLKIRTSARCRYGIIFAVYADISIDCRKSFFGHFCL